MQAAASAGRRQGSLGTTSRQAGAEFHGIDHAQHLHGAALRGA